MTPQEMKENLKLREAVFRKMGWQKSTVTIPGGLKGEGWFPHDKAKVAIPYLPFIEMDWEVTAKYLVPFMRERNIEYQAWFNCFSFEWQDVDNDTPLVSVDIKDDNIAYAACKAFMEVSLD